LREHKFIYLLTCLLTWQSCHHFSACVQASSIFFLLAGPLPKNIAFIGPVSRLFTQSSEHYPLSFSPLIPNFPAVSFQLPAVESIAFIAVLLQLYGPIWPLVNLGRRIVEAVTQRSYRSTVHTVTTTRKAPFQPTTTVAKRETVGRPTIRPTYSY